jgi:hypothetical protein
VALPPGPERVAALQAAKIEPNKKSVTFLFAGRCPHTVSVSLYFLSAARIGAAHFLQRSERSKMPRVATVTGSPWMVFLQASHLWTVAIGTQV